MIYEGLVLKHQCAFLKTHFFTEHLQWRLLLTVSVFQPAALLKRRLAERCLCVNFAKCLRTSFVRTPPDDCFLCLSVNFEKFFRSPLIEYLWETVYFITSYRISTTTYSKQVFHMWFSSIFCKKK